MSDVRLPPGRSAPRARTSPTVSVVVASFRSRSLLDSCLRSLLPQCERHGAELVVARRGDEASLGELREAYPSARFVACPDGADVPRLRAAGMMATSGDIVALTEDHCVAAPDWLDQLTGGSADVMGGAMDNAQARRAVDWAAYFAEYGFFAQPGEAGGVPLLTGANVAYRRSVADRVARWAAEGEWENVVHARLRGSGSTLQFVRSAAVAQNQSYSFRAFCRDRYEHGYAYARRRLSAEALSRPWMYLAGGALLPFVLTGRVARATRPPRRGAFLRALPITFAFLTAWVLGEMVGYWHGPDRPEPADV